MYSENYWTLPGGFRLPVSFIRTEHVRYSVIHQVTEPKAEFLQKTARSYIHQQMTAGEILSEEVHLYSNKDVLTLKGEYSCREMIGQVMHEEILK